MTVIVLAGTKYFMHNDACAVTWAARCYRVDLNVINAFTPLILLSNKTIRRIINSMGLSNAEN